MEESRQNQPNWMGFSEIPLSSLSQPPPAFWCADLFRSHQCRCPHYILLRCFSICTLTVGTTRTSHTPTLAGLSSAKGLWSRCRPLFFFFLHHIMGPFEVWRSASPWLNENSQFHMPCLYWNQSRMFWLIMLFLCLEQRLTPPDLCQLFFGLVKGLSP